jgi:hypothetical protein
MKELLENLQSYFQANIDLAKLEVNEKIDSTTKKATIWGLVAVFAVLTILFLFITLALIVGNLLASTVSGFGLIALLFLILTVIGIYILKRNTKI